MKFYLLLLGIDRDFDILLHGSASQTDILATARAWLALPTRLYCYMPGIVACTRNPAVWRQEVWNSMGSNPLGGSYREPSAISELNFKIAMVV